MDPISTTAATLVLPLLIHLADFSNGDGYRQTTASSVVYRGQKSMPLRATELDELSFSSQNAALEWMMLAKDALPDATPLTPDERVSINEFFWSHFK